MQPAAGVDELTAADYCQVLEPLALERLSKHAVAQLDADQVTQMRVCVSINPPCLCDRRTLLPCCHMHQVPPQPPRWPRQPLLLVCASCSLSVHRITVDPFRAIESGPDPQYGTRLLAALCAALARLGAASADLLPRVRLCLTSKVSFVGCASCISSL